VAVVLLLAANNGSLLSSGWLFYGVVAIKQQWGGVMSPPT
jgi:hypothetical protein